MRNVKKCVIVAYFFKLIFGVLLTFDYVCKQIFFRMEKSKQSIENWVSEILTVPTFNNKFISWLECSKESCTSAKILLDNSASMNQIVYNIQQAIEKFVKFGIGASGIIKEEKFEKQIGHNTDKAFKNAFDKYKISYKSRQYDKYKVDILSRNTIEERFEYAYPYIEKEINSMIKDIRESDIDSKLDYLELGFIKGKYSVEFSGTLNDIHEIQREWECFHEISFWLSLIYIDTESDTRYPSVEKDYAPSDKYKCTKKLQKYLETTIGLLNSIYNMYDNHKIIHQRIENSIQILGDFISRQKRIS